MMKISLYGLYLMLLCSVLLFIVFILMKFSPDNTSLTLTALFSYLGIVFGLTLGAPMLFTKGKSLIFKGGLYTASAGIIVGVISLILLGSAVFAFIGVKLLLLVVLIGFNLMAVGKIMEKRGN